MEQNSNRLSKVEEQIHDFINTESCESETNKINSNEIYFLTKLTVSNKLVTNEIYF